MFRSTELLSSRVEYICRLGFRIIYILPVWKLKSSGLKNLPEFTELDGGRAGINLVS